MGDYKNTIFDLEGKIAIVIGGVGQIGINTTKILLDAGASVVVIDLGSDYFNKTIAKLKEDYKSSNILPLNVDVTSEDELIQAKQEILDKFKSIDILVNLAHYKGDPRALKPHSKFFASLEDYPFDIWKETINTNLNGLFLSCKIFGKQMIEQTSGVIINISSTYGIGSPNKNIYGNSGINSPIAYATTKAAIINFSKYLATHWADKGIRVNILSPGGVGNENQSKEFVKNYSNLTPLNRMSKPDEYQGAILYLASDSSSYMTGSNLVVDGGWTAW